ncbi:GH1 family beta-glucosidase [Catellatospora sp. KI3]|uniref:GH1 family beta-glucosidase n=1 Tax=Catellatospora sp. KI3 TaxID=3041620 RepID=UPI002482C5C2|nr:GH1 family beta-glucosidase [Catellatospora sp. KI3]MDI1462368.1 GH1 family beta-glucosidase [Catellatospora sp. KI3]
MPGTPSAAPGGAATSTSVATGAPNAGEDGTTEPSPAAAPALRFPDGFIWGAATSAYQIEGAAHVDGRGQSVWDTFCRIPGRVRNGETGDVAADHYHRWADDLDLIRELGLKSYRFSVSWPRVIPTGAGPVNRKGLDFYKRLAEGLRNRGVTPMVTLYHWDTPQELQDLGGWENRDTAYRFAEYAATVAQALGDVVPNWLTLNEPKTIVQNGYLSGTHAPGKQDPGAAYVVAHHQLLAHGLAVQAMRPHLGATGRIGPALNLHPCYPADDSPQAQARTVLHDGYENRLYLDPILKGSYPQDVLDDLASYSPMQKYILDGDLQVINSPTELLAVQYYTPLYVTAEGDTVTRYPTTEAFWQQIYPEGMYDILTRIKKDYGDIALTITENGLPTPDTLGRDGRVRDNGRIAFLRDHFTEAHRAITDGVNLESYHVWSLMDNFEWAEGYDQRWGLVYVDYATQQRVRKDSADWYSGVIRANGL